MTTVPDLDTNDPAGRHAVGEPRSDEDRRRQLLQEGLQPRSSPVLRHAPAVPSSTASAGRAGARGLGRATTQCSNT